MWSSQHVTGEIVGKLLTPQGCVDLSVTCSSSSVLFSFTWVSFWLASHHMFCLIPSTCTVSQQQYSYSCYASGLPLNTCSASVFLLVQYLGSSTLAMPVLFLLAFLPLLVLIIMASSLRILQILNFSYKQISLDFIPLWWNSRLKVLIITFFFREIKYLLKVDTLCLNFINTIKKVIIYFICMWKVSAKVSPTLTNDSLGLSWSGCLVLGLQPGRRLWVQVQLMVASRWGATSARNPRGHLAQGDLAITFLLITQTEE